MTKYLCIRKNNLIVKYHIQIFVQLIIIKSLIFGKIIKYLLYNVY